MVCSPVMINPCESCSRQAQSSSEEAAEAARSSDKSPEDKGCRLKGRQQSGSENGGFTIQMAIECGKYIHMGTL